MKRLAALALLLAGGAWALPSVQPRVQFHGEESTLKGHSFAAFLEVGQHKLPRLGVGVMRYKGLFRLYTGALYAPPGVNSAGEALDPAVPKALAVVYDRRLKAADLCAAGDRLLEHTFDEQSVNAIRERLNLINTWYPDTVPGDRCLLVYHPGYGTSLYVNGVLQGRIPGADFSTLYFSIWLGDRPASTSFREALWGRE